jgi:hypothetical protein
MVEFALAMLVFIPVVYYSMYIGDGFIAGFKAQEAEISATWDTTAYRLHNFESGGGTKGLYDQAESSASARIQGDLQGLDSYAKVKVAGAGFSVSGGQLMPGVTCERKKIAGAGDGVFSTLGEMPEPTALKMFHVPSYMQCTAQTRVENRFMPQTYLQGSLEGGEPFLPPSMARIDMCGLGSTPNGCSATRGMIVLTDDWGLENGAEQDVSMHQDGSDKIQNPRYFSAAREVFLAEGKAMADEQVKEVMQFMLGKDLTTHESSNFRMAYLTPISQFRSMSSGISSLPDRAYLTPWRDGESGAGATFESGQAGYNSRTNGNYLGHGDSKYNQP